MTRTRGWSYSAGERGRNRVRVFEHRTGMLYAEWYEHSADGAKPRRQSLGHKDRQKAKRHADQIAARFAQGEREEPRDPSLSELFDNYGVEVTPRKSRHTQKHDRQTMRLILKLFGGRRKTSSLNARDWHRYIAMRREGLLGLPPAKDRTIESDLKFLLAVLNWAVKAHLLGYNPVKGLPLPKEKNPKRPIFADAEYQALRQVAPKVDWRFESAVVLAHETGHRIAAIRALKWSDIDLDAHTILWRAESDKSGREHTTPLTREALKVLHSARRERRVIDDAWLLPALRDPSKPVSQRALHMWMTDAIDRAAIRKRRGLGFHSLRRKFATELRHVPMKDLMSLGGWQDHRTILQCYQHPDMDEMRKTLGKRAQSTHQPTHRKRMASER